MQLNDHFQKFHADISLNSTRVSRIKSAHETWEDILRNDEEVGDDLEDFYLQGSYATHTAIRPQGNKEFDVDAILLLSIDDDQTPKDVLSWLARRMRTQEKYKDSITQRDRCVRVTYAGDFHIDIVPAKVKDGDVILIPSKKEGEWVETNPKGFMAWCRDVNQNSQGKFTRVAKFVKFWRDTTVGQDTAPKSILLVTLIGMNMVGASSDAESLVLTLEELVANLDDVLDEEGKPYVENPSLEGENLARDWNRAKFDIFKDKIERFTSKARDALDEEDKDKSIEKWQEIFGTTFPSTLSEAAQLNKDVAAGRVFVNPSGEVNRDSGVPVRRSRNYGKTAE